MQIYFISLCFKGFMQAVESFDLPNAGYSVFTHYSKDNIYHLQSLSRPSDIMLTPFKGSGFFSVVINLRVAVLDEI